MSKYKWMRPLGSANGTAIPYFSDKGVWKPYTSYVPSIPDSPHMSKGYPSILHWQKLGWELDPGIGHAPN